MQELKPPTRIIYSHGENSSLFLAGSIEMGTAEKWQEKVVKALSDKNIVIFNPRRENWDNSWDKSIDNPKFKEQVDWELDFLEKASIVLFYFDPNTKSPISMMELGLVDKDKPVIVCCPKGFWKRGNIEIVCKRHDLIFCETLDEAIKHLL